MWSWQWLKCVQSVIGRSSWWKLIKKQFFSWQGRCGSCAVRAYQCLSVRRNIWYCSWLARCGSGLSVQKNIGTDGFQVPIPKAASRLTGSRFVLIPNVSRIKSNGESAAWKVFFAGRLARLQTVKDSSVLTCPWANFRGVYILWENMVRVCF